MRGEQPIFNLEIKKKSGLNINPDIYHSKVPSSDVLSKQGNIQIGPKLDSLECVLDFIV